MEDDCHDENSRKFSKKYNIPLMHGQLSQEIGLEGTYNICLKILQRHYNAPPYIDEYTTTDLKHLRTPPNIIDPPQSTVPTKIFQEVWSKMKERTLAWI